MVTMARPKEHPLADIEMGSLTARPVTEKKQISRIHSTVREVFVSPVQELGRKKKQENLKTLQEGLWKKPRTQPEEQAKKKAKRKRTGGQSEMGDQHASASRVGAYEE